MTPDPETTAGLFKTAQIVQLVKENQLVTAIVLFVLWQVGALATALEYTGCT